ncbi:MAG: hypothetical protein CMM51_01895 [Rhodospirillaceae bacterium]|nr:hypothetical protein [Rhodospirillaceae bacterium]
MSNSNFRDFIPLPGESKIAGQTAREHADVLVRKDIIVGIFAEWKRLFSESFTGITSEGKVREGLYFLKPESAPTSLASKAAKNLLAKLSASQIRQACFDITSKNWRNWQNTEIYVENHGLRLENLDTSVRDSVLNVIRSSLSERGYSKTRDIMKLNEFLGQLVGGEGVLGEWSYIFCLFGKPSLRSPWGWQLFGHHLALNCVFIEGQVIISPTFMGAEPNFADKGKYNGLRVFRDEERKGLDLMGSFSADQKTAALIANSMVGGDLPEGRRQLADGLHLGGAYQDNRIIPYEGLKGNLLSKKQNISLLDLVEEYLCFLPSESLKARMTEIETHLEDTHFCWIGSSKENEPFYYRIQSPVILIEFDHHAGVYLTNTEPQNFHVHTLVRTPNGNDYGIDLIRQHYARTKHE